MGAWHLLCQVCFIFLTQVFQFGLVRLLINVVLGWLNLSELNLLMCTLLIGSTSHACLQELHIHCILKGRKMGCCFSSLCLVYVRFDVHLGSFLLPLFLSCIYVMAVYWIIFIKFSILELKWGKKEMSQELLASLLYVFLSFNISVVNNTTFAQTLSVFWSLRAGNEIVRKDSGLCWVLQLHRCVQIKTGRLYFVVLVEFAFPAILWRLSIQQERLSLLLSPISISHRLVMKIKLLFTQSDHMQ